MDLSGQASQARFASYVEALVEVIGHADRAEPLNDYCVGLLMPGERKSVEPMAAIVAPARVSAKHQSLLHLVGQAPWPDEAVLQKIRELVLPGIERQGRIEAWIVDDTGFTKKGTHSVGVFFRRAASFAHVSDPLDNEADDGFYIFAGQPHGTANPIMRLPVCHTGRQ